MPFPWSVMRPLSREIDVLVEGFDESKKLYVGRSQWDAPEVDNQVYVKDEDGDKVVIGDFVRARVGVEAEAL